MVIVPAASFMMGSPDNESDREADEGPQRLVTISRPFAVGKFEVTFAERDACVADGGCRPIQNRETRVGASTSSRS
jgi:formylglycine-generating enzyme required for sulfatase activity